MASFIFYTSSKSGRSLCPTLYIIVGLKKKGFEGEHYVYQ